jgi:hypothetical protein
MPQRIYQAAQQAQQALQQIQQAAQQLGLQGQQGASFTGPQSIMQPGFAGTDAQQVRQDIANSSMNQGNMGGNSQQTGGGFMAQGASFAGPQSVMQPGVAGTDAQQVRRDIANSSMNQGNMGGNSQQTSGGFMAQGASFAGPQSVMQPGFAGTDAQQVRQDIANSSMNQGNMGGNSQQTGGGYMAQGASFAGPQSVMQPGFAGTDAQQVRRDIANSSMNQGNMGGGGNSQQTGGFMGQGASFAGPQSIMQPGFAGTDPQQVRQDIANSSMNQGNMGGGGNSQQTGGFMGQGASFAGPQSIMQPGFAGTDPQKVSQEISNDLMSGSQGGFMQ